MGILRIATKYSATVTMTTATHFYIELESLSRLESLTRVLVNNTLSSFQKDDNHINLLCYYVARSSTAHDGVSLLRLTHLDVSRGDVALRRRNDNFSRMRENVAALNGEPNAEWLLRRIRLCEARYAAEDRNDQPEIVERREILRSISITTDCDFENEIVNDRLRLRVSLDLFHRWFILFNVFPLVNDFRTTNFTYERMTMRILTSYQGLPSSLEPTSDDEININCLPTIDDGTRQTFVVTTGDRDFRFDQYQRSSIIRRAHTLSAAEFLATKTTIDNFYRRSSKRRRRDDAFVSTTTDASRSSSRLMTDEQRRVYATICEYANNRVTL